MGRHGDSLACQMRRSLKSKLALGESKYAAKKGLKFGQTPDKIYSIDTLETYKKQATYFAEWCKTEKGVHHYADFKSVEKYAPEYLKYCENRGDSAWSLRTYKAALSKVYGRTIDYTPPARKLSNIKRSRLENTTNEKHAPETGKWKDAYTIGRATGGRHYKDLEKLTPANFFERDGRLYVRFNQSKGGRDRISPVLPQYQDAVKEILKTHNNKTEKLFSDGVSNHIDIHGLRREYAQNLYKLCTENAEYKRLMLSQYPDRKTFPREKNIQSSTYKTKGEVKETFDRDCVYIVTQALGHNRLGVAVNNYLM